MDQESAMPENPATGWRCPHCKLPLAKAGKQWRCNNNHSFDCAKQGYVNLLPSHKMHSKQPGDNAPMVLARSRFLDGGFYLPLRQQLCSIVQKYLKQSTGSWLDAGCGEGWYTTALAEQLKQLKAFALDISKPAITSCCKRSHQIEWCVASVADIPLPNDSQAMILSIFSRIDWAEFPRILQNNGLIICVSPGKNHLLELRQAIYQQVRPYKEDKALNELPQSIQPIEQQSCQFQLELNSPQEIMDLLSMTPHYWNISPEQRETLANTRYLTTQTDFRIYIFRYDQSQSQSQSQLTE